jgi:tetratricopeptide (TPR) repeat protein
MNTSGRWNCVVSLALAASVCFSIVNVASAQDEKLPPRKASSGRVNPSKEVAEICVAGRSLRNQGQFDAALAEFEKALNTARATKDPAGEAWSISNIATVYRYRAELEPDKTAELIKTAAEHYQQAADISRKNADKYNEAYATLYLGVLAAMRKDVATAERNYAVALPLFRAVNDHYYMGRTYAFQARAAVQRSEFKQAIELYEKALPLLRDVGRFNEVTQVEEELKAAKSALKP